MKSTVILSFSTVLLLAVTSCVTTTHITGSWKKPGSTPAHLNSVFVSALTANIPAKSAVENGLEDMLKSRLKVYKSIDVLPPEFAKSNMNNQAVLLEKIRATSADAIMTVALVDKETAERYVPGTATYAPFLRYNYYSRFSLYWGHWAPYYYTPGYYITDKTYYLETNLYDAKSEELIWSAQSETYNPSNINSFLKGYLTSIERKMVEDGLISK